MRNRKEGAGVGKEWGLWLWSSRREGRTFCNQHHQPAAATEPKLTTNARTDCCEEPKNPASITRVRKAKRRTRTRTREREREREGVLISASANDGFSAQFGAPR